MPFRCQVINLRNSFIVNIIFACFFLSVILSPAVNSKKLSNTQLLQTQHRHPYRPTLHIFSTFNDPAKIGVLSKSSSVARVLVNFVSINKSSDFYAVWEKFRHYIQDIDDGDIVMQMGSFDAIALAPYSEVLAKIQSLLQSEGKELLFSTELNCYPPFAKGGYDGLEQGRTNFQYANGGASAGTVRAWKHFFSWKSIDEMKSLMIHELGADQGFMHNYFFEFPDLVARDTEQIVWQSMYHVSWKELSIIGGRVYNKVLQSFPCILHFNGNSHLTLNWKSIMSEVVDRVEASKIEGTNFTYLSDESPRAESWPQLSSNH